MANKRISELDSLTSIANDDYYTILDVSDNTMSLNGTNKKLLHSTLRSNLAPLTTKGDVLTYSTAPQRIAVGTDNYVLTADSSTATGLKWATVPKLKEVEIDCGATPVYETTATVSDSDVTASSIIIGNISYKAPTGKDLDEIEMDLISVRCNPNTGSFNVLVRGEEGYIADKFIISYTVL